MKEIKCVVWDLDNTIWDGILLEDEKVTLKEGIVEVIRTLDERGILMSIASKNNFDHAMKVLEDFGLEKYFLYPQINWNSKAHSVEEIQKKLNIGMDTIAFVDDMQFERDEVAFSHPEVECIDAADYRKMPEMERLNPKIVTQDSRRRRQMYQEDMTRNESESTFTGPKSEFLKSLNMVFKISLAKEEDLLRLEELTKRTNQLNTTGIQYSSEQLREFMKSPEYDIWVCELEDKYGSYGKIGLALIHKTEQIWTIKLLLMSCRTVSKGVGTVLLSFILKRALNNKKRLLAEFRKTDRNRQMLISYKMAAFNEIDKKDDLTIFENDLGMIQEFPNHIKVEIRDETEGISVGKLPAVGEVPEYMYAWTIRSERLGDIRNAFAEEIVKVPKPGRGEVLVANVCAGVNYNGIWAALGKPKDVVKGNGCYEDPAEDFQICGSEASGIVYAVGEGVERLKVGDRVVVGGFQYNPECPYIAQGTAPEYSPSYRAWGYEGNWGAFAQFCKVYEYQCYPIPKHLSWAEAAACSATGMTIYRMLNHWKGNEIKEGDVVLIWGGAGGLGTSAIQFVKAAGGIPIAVVSSEEKGQFCIRNGAKGYIDRTKYSHWGKVDGLSETEYQRWIIQAVSFRNELYSIIGENKSPDIVIEHPGSDTLATSLFVCNSGGMVVLCGATTGYMASIDLRFLWMNQKRIQGSHAGNIDDAVGMLNFIEKHNIKPVICRKYKWSELSEAPEDLRKGDANGKLVIQICESIDDKPVE